jgi:hypothetical protein
VRQGAFPAPDQNFKGNRGVVDRLQFD